MATHTSALSLYKTQVARFQQTGQTVRAMHSEIVKRAYQDAKELTSGGNGPQGRPRKKWLRRNRPFARNMARANSGVYRRGPGRVKALPIGVIYGQLYGAWNLRLLASSRGQEYHLRNAARHARYILFDAGTSKMLGRGFQAEIRKRFKARNKALIDVIRLRQRR